MLQAKSLAPLSASFVISMIQGGKGKGRERENAQPITDENLFNVKVESITWSEHALRNTGEFPGQTQMRRKKAAANV